MSTATRTPPTVERIDRLNTASLRHIVEPERDLPGHVGDGQVLPDELLAIHELPEFNSLTPDQRRQLSREEVAAIVDAGLRFEAALMAGFALEIFAHGDLTDPRVVYSLHEVGEETRHSRLFSRLLGQLRPEARNPVAPFRRVERWGLRRLVSRPATLDVLVLGGEEIPDLMQKRAAEHPDTDPFLREVNRYHRAEEARHLAYARTVLPERWEQAGAVDRFLVRRVVPLLIRGMFDMMVHPGVYAAVGLPAFRTWRRANRTPFRVGLRHEATRPIVRTLLASDVFHRGRVPRPWRALAGVDAAGDPAA